jgi:hypothetical protein
MTKAERSVGENASDLNNSPEEQRLTMSQGEGGETTWLT